MARKDQRHRRQLSYFKTGANAAQRILHFEEPPHRRHLYVCPLCCTFHDIDSLESGALTEEHVPPSSVGGAPLTLTCGRCNHSAGTTLDSHAAARKRTHDLLNLRSGESRVMLDYGVNAHMRITEGPVHVSVDVRHNDPARFAAFNAAIGWRVSAANAGTLGSLPLFNFGVPIRHNEWKANLSYVRAAYLTVFALYGYRLILGASYQPVRRQLRDIDEQVIRRLVIGNTYPGLSGRSGVFEGFIEGLGAIIVVRFHDRWVGLPADTEDVDWWNRAATLQQYSPLLARNYQALPIRPVHSADFAAIPRGGRPWQRLDVYGEDLAA